jgi:protein-disulfide isomerase
MRREIHMSFTAALIAADFAFPKAGQAEQDITYDPEFAKKVEQVLLEKPEIILKVFELLEQEQSAAEAFADKDLVAHLSDDLFDGLDRDKPILIEFQDYNCGYCRRVHSTVAELRRDMPDLQMVILELPVLGEASVFALKSLEGQEAYERFANALMSQSDSANPASVRSTLTALGFDAQAVIAAAEQGAADGDLDRAARLARAVGARGTPFFVGPGGIVRGAGSSDDLKAITSDQNT